MWQEQILKTADGQLLWCSKGTGKSLIFLHGGPGDEYRSLLPFVEPFTSHFRCIVFDQRGSGGSTLEYLDEATLHPGRFVADLEQLRSELQAERAILVGHSWGAMLALLYGTTYPEQVERLLLIGLGPLSDEMDRVARANLMKPRLRSLHAQGLRGLALQQPVQAAKCPV
ncbi:MAG TPA: alpha/beta hydrolase [Anaerolineae bacterium]|nr:alpha/beta hydrolase [Anaerolineae bacterium]